MMRVLLLGAALLLLATGAARADGLVDLKAALARATAQAPVKALVETRSWRKLGEGKDADEDNGHAHVIAEDGARGLNIVYGKEILARAERELAAKAANPNSKTPTVAGLSELGYREVLPLASAAPAILRGIERGVFKGERSEAWQGKPARVLSFDMPITTLSTRERKYAKSFVSLLDIWIGADGTPLASRLRQSTSGRVFVVISFKAELEEERVFSLLGDRLLTVRQESRGYAAGMGEREERKLVTTLKVQSAEPASRL